MGYQNEPAERIFSRGTAFDWIWPLSSLLNASRSPINEIYMQAQRFVANNVPAGAMKVAREKLPSGVDTELISTYPIAITLQSAAAIRSGVKTSEDISPEEIVRAYFWIWHQLSRSDLRSAEQYNLGFLAALFERQHQDTSPNCIIRAQAMYCEEHDKLSPKSLAIRSAIETAMQADYGTSLARWPAACQWLYLVSHVGHWRQKKADGLSALYAIGMNDPRLTPTGITCIGSALQFLSTTPEIFAAECKSRHDISPFWVTPSLLPLKKYPVIEDPSRTDHFLILSADQLAEASMERPVRFAQDKKIIHPQDTGRLYEDLAHYRLTQIFNEAYTPLAADPDRKRCEGIAAERHALLLFEVKANRTPDHILAKPRPTEDDLRKELLQKRYISHAMEQFTETLDDLASSRLQIQRNTRGRITQAFPILLTVDPIPQGVAFAAVLNEILPPERKIGKVRVFRPTLMSFSELDILACHPTLRIASLIRDRSMRPEWAHEQLTDFARDRLLRSAALRRPPFVSTLEASYADWMTPNHPMSVQ